MKNLNILPIVYLFILTLGLNSCTKEAGIKEVEKLSAADCPRLASLTAEKKEILYTVSTFAGADQQYNYNVVNGVLCKARFGLLWGIAIAPDGTIYISDRQIHNIRKISTKGVVSTFAGEPVGGGFCQGGEDGIGTAALFCSPLQIVIDKAGILQVIDQTGLNTIRKISPSAEVSTFINGFTRESGYQDGPLAEAKFEEYLRNIAVSNDGSVYLNEGNNLIRKISTNAIVSTYAGQVPVNGQPQQGYQDGPKENALFGYITDMAFGPDGRLYFCDHGNKKLLKITTAGIVETLADVAVNSIAISEKGVIFAASGQQVFEINTNGTVQIVAGNGTSDYKDGVGTEARFRDINYMAIHKNYLYMTDGSTVRRMNIE